MRGERKIHVFEEIASILKRNPSPGRSNPRVRQHDRRVKRNILRRSHDDVSRTMRKHGSWYNSPLGAPWHTRVWHNYGLISAVFHRMAAVPCDRQYAKRVRVREREITRRIYTRVWPGLYIHGVHGGYNCGRSTRSRGEGGEERRKPLLRNFVNGAAPRAINVIKCWMRTCRRRWNCAFTRANSRQLSDATVDVAANTDSIKRRFRITNGTRRHCVTCGVQLEKRWICHETD